MAATQRERERESLRKPGVYIFIGATTVFDDIFGWLRHTRDTLFALSLSFTTSPRENRVDCAG